MAQKSEEIETRRLNLKKDLYMSPRQLEYFKERLQEIQQRLWAKAREGWTELTSGQERRADMADRIDAEMATTGRCNELARANRRIAEIDAALQRIG